MLMRTCKMEVYQISHAGEGSREPVLLVQIPELFRMQDAARFLQHVFSIYHTVETGQVRIEEARHRCRLVCRIIASLSDVRRRQSGQARVRLIPGEAMTSLSFPISEMNLFRLRNTTGEQPASNFRKEVYCEHQNELQFAFHSVASILRSYQDRDVKAAAIETSRMG